MNKLIAVFALLPTLALAQVPVQPTYIRPSKGASISVTLTKNVASGIYDFTAFNAVQVTFLNDNGIPPSGPPAQTRRGTYAVDNLNQFIRFKLYASGVAGEKDVIITETSPTKDAASFQAVRAPNGLQTLFLCEDCASINIVFTPLPLSPNIGIQGLYQAGQPITGTTPLYPATIGGTYFYWDTSGSTDKYAHYPADMEQMEYPFIKVSSPLDYTTTYKYPIFTASKNVTLGNPSRGGTIVPVVALVGNTTVFSGSSYVYGNREWSRTANLHNVGTVPVLCKLGSSGNVTTSNYQASLSAGTADNDGKGGRYSFTGLLPDAIIKCAGDGGAGRVALEHF